MNKTDKAVMTADKANELQALWMALDSNGPKSEIDRVIKAYEAVPTSYIAQSDSGQACVMIKCQPCTASNLDVATAEILAKKHGVQTSLRWNTKGLFFNV